MKATILINTRLSFSYTWHLVMTVMPPSLLSLLSSTRWPTSPQQQEERARTSLVER